MRIVDTLKNSGHVVGDLRALLTGLKSSDLAGCNRLGSVAQKESASPTVRSGR